MPCGKAQHGAPSGDLNQDLSIRMSYALPPRGIHCGCGLWMWNVDFGDKHWHQILDVTHTFEPHHEKTYISRMRK